jgi:REP element-mobilizing transposase RayT
MSEKFQDKYRIPSARWQNWDYGWNGAYFITICTAGHECVFGEILDGKMILSNLGIIADVFWHEIKNHCNTVELDAFVVMPNHIHGILLLTGNEKNGDDYFGCHDEDIDDDSGGDVVETRHALSLRQNPQNPQNSQHPQPPPTPGQQRFRNQGKNTVSSIIGSYKSAVAKHAHRLGFNFDWQSRFHDHIIRSDGAYQRISAYIQNNPLNWPDDKFYNES